MERSNSIAQKYVSRREMLRYGVSLAAMSTLGGSGTSALAQITHPFVPFQTTTKPNIVFILMDNLGYGEVGCYGGGVTRGAATPRIDKLATEGTRLTNFNVEAQCTPSRSALMTGRFAIRSGTHSVPRVALKRSSARWRCATASCPPA